MMKPVEAWATSQSLIPTGGRSGLETHIATTGKRFIVRADEKLTAFVELESPAFNQAGDFPR
jgi:hypothetical protein